MVVSRLPVVVLVAYVTVLVSAVSTWSARVRNSPSRAPEELETSERQGNPEGNKRALCPRGAWFDGVEVILVSQSSTANIL